MCELDVSQEDEPLSWLSPQDPNAGIAEPENTEAADPKLVPLHPSSNHGPGAGAADFWNMDSLQRLATDAAIKGIANSPIKMPWEKGPLAPLFTDLNVLGQSWADPPRVGMLDAATPATLAPAISKDLHQSQRTMAKKRAERLFELVHEVAEEQDPEPRPNLEVEDSGSDADLDEASDQPLMDHLRGILGAAPSGAAASSYCRLYFESHALSLQDLKSRLERSESSEARVLPLAEKMERIRQQKQRLQGLIWTPCTEPSNALIDKVCQQMDDGCVAYLELSRCTSRQQETLNEKHDHQLRLDSSGALKLKKQRVDDSPIHGETKLRQAFLRRSLAYDLANIASFTVLETWTNRLFEKMDEAQPSGFRQVSLEQALACDRVLWTRVADATRAKLAADPVAGKPFDKAFEEWSRHPEVLCYLSPLPQATSSRPKQAPKAHAPPKPPAYKGGPGEKGKGKGLLARGGPPPLRDEYHLMGLPGL
ncbi:unnamed protein product, partial [Effrenium voratum]